MIKELFIYDKEGNHIQDIDEHLKDTKLLGLYFSKHTCPPCREFTPLLADLYEEINEDDKQMEIVFLSGDKSLEEYTEYYEEMPWLRNNH